MTLPKKSYKVKYYRSQKIITSKRDLRLTAKYLETILTTTHLPPNENTIDECPVCYHPISNEKNFAVTECGHRYCFPCIARCIRTSNLCPLCRDVLDKTESALQPQQRTEPITMNQATSVLQRATRTRLRVDSIVNDVRRRLHFLSDEEL